MAQPGMPTLPTGVQYTQDFYVYTANFGTITGSGTTFTQNIQIQADSYFEWVETTAQGILTGLLGSTSNPIVGSNIVPVTMNISDSGSGRSLFFQPVPLNMVAGTGQFPYILPVPRLFMPNSNVQIQLTMFDSTSYSQVYVALIGRKIFQLG